MRNVAKWTLCLALGAGCVEQPAGNRGGAAQGASQQELEAIRRRVVSRTAPTPQNRLDFNYSDKVTLLGYDINVPGDLRPGQSVTITWHWHCRAQVGNGWRLFTHLDDANGPRTNQDNVGDARRAYQPERWRAGEYIRDTQTFDLPADWDSPVVRVHVGFWKDAERLAVTPANRTDGQRRARAIERNTGIQIQVSELPVPRATGPINVDGNLDEAAWNTAAQSGPLVNTANGNPPDDTTARANVRVLWDNTNLYLGYVVADQNLVDPSANRDDHLWEHDAVELMIDPDGDGHDYYEFQVSPRNQHFDSRYDTARAPGPFGHLDFNPEIRSAVSTRGTIGNADDNDEGYTVEVAIPWASIPQGLAHNPPQEGDTLRLNLFVMDEPKSGGQRVAGWSAPRRGDFHTLERFGRVTLAPAPSAGAVPTGAPGAPGNAVVVPAGGPNPTAAPRNVVLPLPPGLLPVRRAPAPGAAAPAPAPAR